MLLSCVEQTLRCLYRDILRGEERDAFDRVEKVTSKGKRESAYSISTRIRRLE